jgi:hypothetical protein
MIGLMFLVIIGFWIMTSIFIGRRLPRWLKLKPVWSWLFIPLVFFAPVMDEAIGRWQFARLCDREAVVWLSPNWQSVQAARSSRYPIIDAGLTFIPIRIQRVEHVDAATGLPFMSYIGFHTSGGLLLGRLGLGLGQSTSCWPKNDSEVLKMIDIDNLLEKGKSK